MYHGRLQSSFYKFAKVFTQLHKTAYRTTVFISVAYRRKYIEKKEIQKRKYIKWND